MSQVLLLNKPYDVLCQFTPGYTDNTSSANASDMGQKKTLADYVSAPGYYPAGRLDKDSEGLVLLTNDGKLQNRISHPNFKLPKTYVVQVDGLIDEDAAEQLRRGIQLKDGKTKPGSVTITDEPAWLWPRTPPVRFRKNIPTSWISISISEGRNRQVRRMTAAVGYPTLRLIRTAIGPYNLAGIALGEVASAEYKTL